MATETVYTTGKSSTNARINIGSGALSSEDGQIAFPDECTSIKLVGAGSHPDGLGTLLIIDSSGVIKKAGGSKTTIATVGSDPATPTTYGTVYGQTMTDGNVIIGSNAAAGLVDDATSNDNTAIGRESLFSVTAGTNGNTAVGTFSLYTLTTGTGNTAIGRNSADFLTTGINNTFIGQGTLTSVVDCTNSIALGAGANITANTQLAIADIVEHIKMTGLGDAADGDGILLSIDSNGIIRRTGGTSKTVSLLEAAIASSGAAAATTTSLGTVYGNTGGDAGFGSATVVIGYGIASAFQAANSTVIGHKCGATGFPSMTSSSGDTVIGSYAMRDYTSGSNNVAIGLGAGQSSSTGSGNTFVGTSSGVSTLALSGVIALGKDAIAKAANEFAIAPTITQWRSEGLTGGTEFMTPLAISSAGIIQSMPHVLAWGSFVQNDYSQAISSGGANAIISGLVVNFGNASYLTSGTTFTVPAGYGFPVDGLWEVYAQSRVTGNAALTAMNLEVLRNGTVATTWETALNASQWVTRGGARIIKLSPSDAVTMRMGWTSGSATTVTVKAGTTYLQFRYLGATGM
ncbi:hypothetical protein PV-S19_0021 [Pacmanvirus S19]|nr:hypothetical protein PV-S19_0021 [Pacmanvirus S19]